MINMRNFAETFSDFLAELKNNIIVAMTKSNPQYEKLKAENEQRLMQLKSLTPLPLLDDYIETLYAIASFETNYCYICGMSDSNMPNKVNPTDDSVSCELHYYEKYTQWKALATEQYSKLQSILTPECCAVLTQYNETKDIIDGLEKQYCYSGGIFDKAKIDKSLDPANTTEWESITDIFL